MVDFETSSSKSEIPKSNSWKITSFSKTMALQSELFLTMFYTINLSPLLVTVKGYVSGYLDMLYIDHVNLVYNKCDLVHSLSILAGEILH